MSVQKLVQANNKDLPKLRNSVLFRRISMRMVRTHTRAVSMPWHPHEKPNCKLLLHRRSIDAFYKRIVYTSHHQSWPSTPWWQVWSVLWLLIWYQRIRMLKYVPIYLWRLNWGWRSRMLKFFLMCLLLMYCFCICYSRHPFTNALVYSQTMKNVKLRIDLQYRWMFLGTPDPKKGSKQICNSVDGSFS